MINGIGHPEEWCLAVQQAALTTLENGSGPGISRNLFPFS